MRKSFMYNSRFRSILLVVGAFTIVSVLALWTFNALAELFSWPQAQFRHAIAVVALLLTVKWALTLHRDDQRIERFRH